MKSIRLPLTISTMAILLSACGGGDAETDIAAPVPEPESSVSVNIAETIAPEPTPTAELSEDERLLKRGRIVWFKCRSCHEVTIEGPHKVGPNLHGLMGATAGAKEGFVFSDEMKNSGIVWTAETLDGFIEKPSTYVKGTKMAFVGVKKESDRQALIKYLEENTK